MSVSAEELLKGEEEETDFPPPPLLASSTSRTLLFTTAFFLIAIVGVGYFIRRDVDFESITHSLSGPEGSTLKRPSSVNGNPTVNTKYGPVQGFTVKLPPEERGGRLSTKEREHSSVDVFFGVPFAKPPIGALRFEVGGRVVGGGWGYKSWCDMRRVDVCGRRAVKGKLPRRRLPWKRSARASWGDMWSGRMWHPLNSRPGGR